MSEDLIGQFVLRYGIAGAIALGVFWAIWKTVNKGAGLLFIAGQKLGNDLVESIDAVREALTAAVIEGRTRAEKHSTEIANVRNDVAAARAEFRGFSDRLTGMEARRDGENWGDVTPVHDIDDRPQRRKKPQ